MIIKTIPDSFGTSLMLIVKLQINLEIAIRISGELADIGKDVR